MDEGREMELPLKPAVRFQWMRQPDIQTFGAQEEVYLLTKKLWPWIEPLVREYSASMMQEDIRKDTYVSLQRGFLNNAPTENVRILSIEGPEALTPRPGVAYFSLEVNSFESPEARQWGSLDDEEVYGWKCGGKELYLWFDYVVGKIKTFNVRKEKARVVPFLDGFAVALYRGRQQVGWLGRKGSIATESSWVFVSRRIAERIAAGCLYDLR
jgi:hypothetical protein